MAMDQGALEVGHCYELSDARRCRITALVSGRVQFEALGQGQSGSEDAARFAEKVAREIECPEPPRRTPSQAEG